MVQAFRRCYVEVILTEIRYNIYTFYDKLTTKIMYWRCKKPTFNK